MLWSKHISLILNTIEREEKIVFACGFPPLLKQIAQYFINPEKLYQDRYQSMNLGIGKIILFLKYLKARRAGKKYEKVSEIMPLKGLMIGGMDSKLYINSLIEWYEVEPYNLYASTEGFVVMMGPPDRKEALMPMKAKHP